MFDVGFWEVAIIGVLALIILGPERLPGVARTAGAWIGKGRRMMREIKADIKTEMDDAELGQLKSIGEDLKQAGESFKSQVETASDDVIKQASSMDNAIADALNKPAKNKPPKNKLQATTKKKISKKKKIRTKKATSKKKITSKPLTKKTKVSKQKVASKAPSKKAPSKKAPSRKAQTSKTAVKKNK